MKKEDVQKELYKNKVIAKFSFYTTGNLYYTIQLESGIYQFPISVIENKGDLRENIILSTDLGNTSFYVEIKASELNRWIGKAIDKEEFIKIQ